MTTKPVKAFKLTSIAGAYYEMSIIKCLQESMVLHLQRKELDAYLTMMEEARKRDHRKLGKNLVCL